MRSCVDQLGRRILVHQPPTKIISLVPSQTELLFDLGLEDEVVGITKFCVHPRKWFHAKTRVGGTKQLNIEKIRSLNPQLIIANKEENVQSQVEELAKEFPVWISDVSNLESALGMIAGLGRVTGKDSEAMNIAEQISSAFESLQKKQFPAIRCAYLIWKEPFMTVGGDTFINDMLKRCGFENVFAARERYPETSTDELKEADCQIIFLSSEPFPFKQKHAEELQFLLPSVKIILVDGEMFSWYGSRLLLAPAYFRDVQNQVLSLANGAGAE